MRPLKEKKINWILVFVKGKTCKYYVHAVISRTRFEFGIVAIRLLIFVDFQNFSWSWEGKVHAGSILRYLNAMDNVKVLAFSLECNAIVEKKIIWIIAFVKDKTCKYYAYAAIPRTRFAFGIIALSLRIFVDFQNLSCFWEGAALRFYPVLSKWGGQHKF